MVIAKFFKNKKGVFSGFVFKGHADFAEKGKDIVCAGISSCVIMCCNVLTEFVKDDVKVCCDDEKISLKTSCEEKFIQYLLIGLKNHIKQFEEKYPKNVKLKIVEVWKNVKVKFTVFCT